ncbi:MAG: nicotinamide riboside transporter PnuC [Erysipelotrichia bacterium]|nr:nicotinamide riboside transporter PnuC [Erysipelotrichia bacterium]
MAKKWNLYEKCYLIIGIIIVTIIALVSQASILSLIYSILCIFNAILIAKGKKSGYVYEILATIIYLYISSKQKYYSEVIISAFILLPSSVYGLYNWSKGQNKEENIIIIKDLKKKELLISMLSQIILYPFYYLMLKHFNTALPFISALSISISALAFYYTAKMSTLGYVFFLLKDMVGLTLWIYPLLLHQKTTITVFITFILYTINDCYGLINWSKMKKQQKTV